MSETYADVAIIGGGPAGIACAIEAGHRGLSCTVIEKGGIADSIRRFPVNMTFFSTPELLELDDIPFTTTNFRPNRAEVLRYYAKVAAYRRVSFLLHTEALAATATNAGVRVETSAGIVQAKALILATGYFDTPNVLGIPGENLPHVTHYYDEPYRYTGSRVAVVGGKNSAVETALELYRHGAQVTMIHRGGELGRSVKYWMKPDIENRLKNGEIAAIYNADVREIRPKEVVVQDVANGEFSTLPADFVVLHTGYRPDAGLLARCGVGFDGRTLIPAHNPHTFETTTPRIYVAGSVLCGCESYNIFIENGRKHAAPIIADIAKTVNPDFRHDDRGSGDERV